MQRTANKNDPWSGHWCFPGGKIEDNETPLECAVRETFEEIGLLLDVQNLHLTMEPKTAGNAIGRAVKTQPYAFKVAFDIINDYQFILEPSEVQQYQWINLSDFNQESSHQVFQPGGLAVAKGQTFPSFPIKNNNHPMPLWGFTYEVLKSYWQI